MCNITGNVCGEVLSDKDMQCPKCSAPVGKIEIYCPKCGYVFETRKGTLSKEGASSYLKKSYVCPNGCKTEPNVRFTYLSVPTKGVKSSYQCDNCGQPIPNTVLQCPKCSAPAGKIEIYCPKCGYVFETRKATLSEEGASSYLKKSYVCPNGCKAEPNVQFTYLSVPTEVGCAIDDGDK